MRNETLADWMAGDVRCLVRVGGVGGLCGYVGVPLDHPLAGKPYDDVDLDVHGGLTFAEEGGHGSGWPAGWYWLGWDYSHLGDYLDCAPSLGGKRWTLDEVRADVTDAANKVASIVLSPVENVSLSSDDD